MLVSSPRETLQFFPSDQSNWASILDTTELGECLRYETYMTGLQEKVPARIERNFDDCKKKCFRRSWRDKSEMFNITPVQLDELKIVLSQRQGTFLE